MTCALCDAVALYLAGGRGFCRTHYDDARAASSRDVARALSMRSAQSGHDGNRPNGQHHVRRKFGSKGGYGRGAIRG